MSANNSTIRRPPPVCDPLEQIKQLLESLRFGSIKIVVHEGKVVEIERNEKFRPNGSH